MSTPKPRELVMAKLHYMHKNYKEAEKCFNEFLTLNPEDVSAYKLLAKVYEQTNFYDKAFKMYEISYLLKPEKTDVLVDICRILLTSETNLENVDKRKWLDLATKAHPSDPIVMNLKSYLSTVPQEVKVVTPPKPIQRIEPDESTKHIHELVIKIEDALAKMNVRLTTTDKKISAIENCKILSVTPFK